MLITTKKITVSHRWRRIDVMSPYSLDGPTLDGRSRDRIRQKTTGPEMRAIRDDAGPSAWLTLCSNHPDVEIGL
ncbi:MAG: hypothetical protein M3464_00235 [Chloroflexota bacterium]|nr:hypothetical protein [Chloroflexota bacterium]